MMTKQISAQLPKRVRNHVNPLADSSVISFDGFKTNKPIIIDIGAYRGEFSQQLSQRFEFTHNIIVTEIRKPYACYLRELFAHDEHVAVFDGDSSRNIQGLIQTSIDKGTVIEYIFINFSDPWFKKKHKKRRVLNTHFLDTMARIGQSETKIIFQTDQKGLFDETVELVNSHPDFDMHYFDNPLWDIQSYWEIMKIKESDRIYRMSINKINLA